MKKAILMYESDKENHLGIFKAEGNLLDLVDGAGEILKEVSKMAAKALDKEPADMAIRIAGATLDLLMEEKKGEGNE